MFIEKHGANIQSFHRRSLRSVENKIRTRRQTTLCSRSYTQNETNMQESEQIARTNKPTETFTADVSVALK